MVKKTLKDFERASRDHISGEVSFDEVTRGVYATDASIHPITPVAVVLPYNDADVRATVKTAAEYVLAGKVLLSDGTTLECSAMTGSFPPCAIVKQGRRRWRAVLAAISRSQTAPMQRPFIGSKVSAALQVRHERQSND